MTPKFDYFKLRLPSDSVVIKDASVFSHIINKDGEETQMRYVQSTPFSYEILIDLLRNITFVSFSGKALLENYPALICSNNIIECFKNINTQGICEIDTTKILKKAIVRECDVTTDISYSGTITDLLDTLILKSKNYTISKKCDNRFYIQTTYVTRRKHECMVIFWM
ncbi:MAG: hypothetical protein K2J82_11240 [Muribaculaceae bacterium]|nr:hypothetical protein [Muribaculaceae bacterium]